MRSPSGAERAERRRITRSTVFTTFSINLAILGKCVIIIMSMYTSSIIILTLFTLVFLVVSVGSSEDDEERLSSRAYWGRRWRDRPSLSASPEESSSSLG